MSHTNRITATKAETLQNTGHTEVANTTDNIYTFTARK